MSDIQLEIVQFLIRKGFILGQDFSIDAKGDLMIGNSETYEAVADFIDSIT